MLNTPIKPVVTFLAAMVLSGTALAQTAPPDPRAFTANAVQTLPDGGAQTGMIAKSGTDMRLETTIAGQTSIQIMRGAEGIAYILDPQTQTYFEMRDPSISEAVSGASSPCPPPNPAVQVQCTQNGTEKVSGVTTQRYEIQGPQDAQPTIILWDAGRRRALGQTWPDGSTLTMNFQGMEEIGGRDTEHWQSLFQAQGQPTVYNDWWFDAQLVVVVRENLPGGITRELTDIQAGPVDPALFMPPEGWQQVAPPQPAAPAGQ